MTGGPVSLLTSLCSHRLLSTITEPTSSGSCDPTLAEEASSPPLVSEESEMDRTDHGGSKKVCFKVCEEDQEDSGHDTMSYRDSYRWGRPGLGGSCGVWCEGIVEALAVERSESEDVSQEAVGQGAIAYPCGLWFWGVI